MGTYEMGTYEMGTYEIDTYEMGTYEMGTYEIDTYEMGTYEMVEQALTYINDYPDLVDFVKNFDEDSGFMWSSDERKIKILDGINNPNHSPTSFALTLRICQTIHKGQFTLEEYKESYGLLDEKKQEQLNQKLQSQKRIFH